MRCGRRRHILGVRPLLAAVVEPVEHIEYRLWVLLLLLLADVGVHQQTSPGLWHSLFEFDVGFGTALLV